MGSHRGGLLLVLMMMMMMMMCFSGTERLVEASGSRGGWWLVIDLDGLDSRVTHNHRTSLLVWDMLRAFQPRHVTVSCHNKHKNTGNGEDVISSSNLKTMHVVSVSVQEERQVAERIVQGSMIGHARWCGWRYYYDVMSSGGSLAVCWVGLPAVAVDEEFVGIRVSMHSRKELGDAREKSWWPWGVKSERNLQLIESTDAVAEHDGDDEVWRVVGGSKYNTTTNTITSLLGWRWKREYIHQDGEMMCVVEHIQETSLVRMVVFGIGALVTLYAGTIASSTACRVAGGSLVCIALSGVLLLFIIWRHIPHKRSILAVVSMWSGAAYMFWKLVVLPYVRLDTMVWNPFLVAYVVISGLIGMSVTYYVNDEKNEKVYTMLKVGLRLLGCVVMCLSTTTRVAGCVLIGVGGCVLWVGQRMKERRKRSGTQNHIRKKELRMDVSDVDDGSEERMDHDDVGHDEPPSTPTVFRVSTVGHPPTPEDYPDPSRLHSLVQRNKVLNVETDRTIAIGKGTYNALYLRGYEVDFEKGTITPPGGQGKKSR